MNRNPFFFVLLLLVSVSVRAQFGVPSISPISGPGVVCSAPAAPKSFSTSASNFPTSYFWSVSPSASVIIGSPNASVTSISFPNLFNTYTVYCFASNAIGASPTVSFVVNCYETPKVSFSGSYVFCQGSPTQIQASPTTISASSTISYSWTPNTGLNNAYTGNPIASPNSTTNYTVTFAIGSCTNSTQVNVIFAICNGIFETPALDQVLMIYPNPNQGDFRLKSEKDMEVLIFDNLGKLERAVKIERDKEASVTGLSPGVYFILSGNRRQKLIITD